MDGSATKPEQTEADFASANATPSEALVQSLQPQALSKTQQKKLLKKQQWEAGKEERRARRREKKKEQRTRKRAKYHASSHAEGEDDGQPNSLANTDAIASADTSGELSTAKHHRQITVPLAFVIDCQFNDLMREGELISLGTQLTRSYSTNRKALYRVHLAISSFGGALKERFESVLNNHHENWHNVLFSEDKFDAVALNLHRSMRTKTGGTIAGALTGQTLDILDETSNKSEDLQGEQAAAQVSSEDAATAYTTNENVVYLTSDSPNTIDTLQAGTVYVIGGLVDKNRHKGVCYKTALDAGINTARLPIEEYIRMASRAVLTTNQVVEIMIRWIETGDWASAFLSAIPKRKGGEIRNEETQQRSSVEDNEHGNADDNDSSQENSSD